MQNSLFKLTFVISAVRAVSNAQACEFWHKLTADQQAQIKANGNEHPFRRTSNF